MNWLHSVFYIKDDTDYNHTAIAISDGIRVKGLNVWLMISSALLASIGLDTNSTAVIIGAMLISPLMSSILGAGFSVGVQDKELFIRSVANLFYITFFSLLTSVVYFLITPLGDPTAEIMARTQPTVLDIGVAFFGGIAGIISTSRKEKINAIPGVAIATALMPPLCAAGFGLATGRWEVFGGAFYLFFINAVFIAFSTYLIVKLLQFPLKNYVDKAKQKRVARLAFLVVILASIPSFWFLYTVYQKNRTKHIIQNNLISDFHYKGNEILKWEIEDLDTVILVKTFFSGQPVSDSVKRFYNSRLQELGLKRYKARFFRINLTKSEMDKMTREMTEAVVKNIEVQNARMRDSVQALRDEIDQGLLYQEVKALYPGIHALGVSQMEIKGGLRTDTIWAAYLQWDTVMTGEKRKEANTTLERFLKARLRTDSVLLQHADKGKVP
ncbi:MAG: TIGR00341 family protein [Chitinophagaceae bacterium]|nr:TIGR00341 family protein [Chitinophagaceae bacterium]